MARGKSVVQGEEYWGASYLKGLVAGITLSFKLDPSK